MSRVVQVLVSTGVLFVGAQAHGADPAARSTMNKRQVIAQMVDCMKKRMSADKSRSYGEAMKICKDQISKESDGLPSSALVASETQPKL